MARGRSSGFGSSRLDDSAPVSGSMVGTFFQAARPTFVRAAKSFLLLLAVSCLLGWLAVPGFAQDEDQNVHLVPHEAKKPDAGSGCRDCSTARGHCRSQPQDAHQAAPQRRGPGAGSGDHHRSDEPAGDRAGEGQLSAHRQRTAAGDPALLQRRRADFAGRHLRHQRLDDRQDRQVARGGGRVLPHRQSAGRVFPDHLLGKAGGAGRFHLFGRRHPEQAGLRRCPKAGPRCSMPFTWA